ncbi:VTT domain-containing protein [Gemmatimonadota bacterium]
MGNEQPRFKRKTFVVWLVCVVVFLSLYYANRDWFTVDLLRGMVNENKAAVIAVYLTTLSLLGLTFIPSTPFSIAGVFLFSPALAYFLNLVGILTSSTIVYHFAHFLGLHAAFEAKYPQQIKKTQTALSRKELPIIMGWSFFPAVPTDLIIYVASTLSIPLWKCLLGVLLGEGTLNAFYIFSVGWSL